MSIPRTMRATVLTAPHRFELQERPVPALGPEDVEGAGARLTQGR